MLGLDPEPPLVGSVSTVVVTYHTGRDLLKLCISSSLQQCDEVVVVDNGNPPEVSGWLAQRDDITLVTPPGNVGFSRACNLGAAAATGSHLFFLNPDAGPRYRCVEHLLRTSQLEERPMIYGPRVLESDAVHEQRGSRRRLLTPLRFFTGISAHQKPTTQFQRVGAVSGSAMFMTRETFDALGGFDERYFLHVEDLDMCKRAHDMGGGVLHVPDAEVIHQGGTSDVANWVVETHKRMGFKTYMLTHFPVAGRLLWPAMSLALTLRNRRSR